MKYLVLFFSIFLNFSLFAQDFKTELSEIDRDVYITQRLNNLKTLFLDAPQWCSDAKKGLPQMLLDKCIARTQEIALSEFDQTIGMRAQKQIEDAAKKVTSDASEVKCVSHFRAKLESLNIAYQTSDDCLKLKSLVP